MKSVLSSGFGGLGDNLMFSTLPELYAKKGEQFYIQKDNPRRNQEIFDLVWGKNPHVKISDEVSNIGFNLTGNPYQPLGDSFIGSVEKHHGFEGTGNYPKIYYNPQLISIFDHKCVIDLTAITRHSDYPTNIAEIAFEEAKKNFRENDICFLTFPNVQSKNYLNVPYATYEIKNIYEYCDIIHSSEKYISLHSGGNMLATAIKQEEDFPGIFCYITKSLFDYLHGNGNQALFDNNTYILI